MSPRPSPAQKRADELARQSTAPIGYQPSDLFNVHEVSIKDGENPFALVNLLDGPFLKAIEALPDSFFAMDEKALKELVNPDELTCRLRISFWDEYNAACDEGPRAMRVAAIMRGLTYSDFFYKQVLSDEKRLAWIVRPPQDFLLAMRDCLHVGMGRLREILSMPLVDRVPCLSKGQPVLGPDGKVLYREVLNTKIVSEIRIITEKMADRVHGAVIQRGEMTTKSASLHLHAQADPLAAMPADALAALDQQLASVTQRLAALQPPLEAEATVLDGDALFLAMSPAERKAAEAEIEQKAEELRAIAAAKR